MLARLEPKLWIFSIDFDIEELLKTDLRSPFISLEEDLEDYLLDLVDYGCSLNYSYRVSSIELLRVLIDAFLADYLIS